MARIGLHGLRYAVLTDEAASGTYDAPATIGKAIAAKLALELNSAELYADNALAESDYTFNKGTLTLTIDNDDDTTLAALLGRTLGSTGEDAGVTIRKNTDTAPYVGVGRVVTKIVNGVYKYKGEFLSKVKFKEPAPEENTKGESVEFGTTDLEGGIAVLPSGEWSRTKTFDTKEAAEAFIDTCFGVSAG